MIFEIIDITNDTNKSFYINRLRNLIQDKEDIYKKGGEYLIYIDKFLLNYNKIYIYIGKSLVHDTYYNFIRVDNNLKSIYFNIYKGKKISQIDINNFNLHEVILSKDRNNFYLEEELIKIYKRDNNKEELTFIELDLLRDTRYSLVSTLDLKIIGIFENIKEFNEDHIILEEGIIDINKFPSLIKEDINKLFRITTKFITEEYILDKEKILIFDRKYNKLLYSIEIIKEIITNKYNDEKNIGFINRIKCQIKKQN